MRILRFLLSALFLYVGVVFAQFESPIKWTVSAKLIESDIYEINVSAKIGGGYSIYSHDISPDIGPVPTTIEIKETDGFKKEGALSFDGKKEVFFDPIWETKVAKFKKEVTFKQRVKLLKDEVTIKGYYEAQACNDQMCFPPDGDDFELKLKKSTLIGQNLNTSSTDSSLLGQQIVVAEELIPMDTSDDNYQSDIVFNWDKANVNCVQTSEADKSGIAWIFVLGFLGGLIALLTPCVFPMIPLTVSYFTKGGKDKKKGIQQAALYGISIILIYVLLGLSITLLFGADALNVMSTSVFFNLLFFVIFVIFALSFFGLFEITLPSSWANKTDQLSNKGGMLGIFFMAFTLALVSFSCTGPIIGSLLVQAATDIGPSLGIFKVKPIIGMLGFSVALALPFTLFALFPQWLKGLPKSGGWLSKVKVILGLLELAFAFKFLSVVDLTQGWGVLRWELFMGIWIVIFMIIGFYGMGLFSKEKTPIAIRLFGVASILFALYMFKNTVSYQPVHVLSGLAPTTHYNFFNQEVKAPYNTTDFNEALKMAKKENKPILIDFSGYGCVNCREMEEKVWIKDDIQALMGDFIIASLYVDDRTPLPVEEQYQSSVTGKLKNIKTIGNKWTDFEIRNFQKASQPYYVIVDQNLNILNTPIGYSDENVFRSFLQCGLNEFNNLKK
ncbi:MAG: thioredoxin family protein [Chitinophagales bacterium]|nr:thioredoxin family protein [Chitinophagales bacterium]MCZ2394060.1 thioredoxin family protein [Chitinophagales bacterium]